MNTAKSIRRLMTHLCVLFFVTAIASSCASTASGRSIAVETLPSWAARADGPSSARARENPWSMTAQNLDDEKGWQVFERDDPTTGLRAFRLVGPMAHAPMDAANALRARMCDPALVDEGQYREVLEVTENSCTVQSVAELPFPFQNRETTEKFVLKRDAETGTIHVVSDLVHDVEPPEGTIRLAAMRTVATFAPLSDGRSVHTIDIVFDLGGNFPNALLNVGVGQGMVKDFEKVREIAARQAR